MFLMCDITQVLSRHPYLVLWSSWFISLMNMMQHFLNQNSAEMQQVFISTFFSLSAEPNTLFRSNSLASKSMESFLKVGFSPHGSSMFFRASFTWQDWKAAHNSSWLLHIGSRHAVFAQTPGANYKQDFRREEICGTRPQQSGTKGSWVGVGHSVVHVAWLNIACLCLHTVFVLLEVFVKVVVLEKVEFLTKTTQREMLHFSSSWWELHSWETHQSLAAS